MLRHAMYSLRGGFLIRPLTIALALGCAGAFLSWLEEEFPTASAWVPTFLFPSHADPQVAQVILAGIAGSIMTVVSIVFVQDRPIKGTTDWQNYQVVLDVPQDATASFLALC